MHFSIVFFFFMLTVFPAGGSASDWRVHLGICNQDPACAREQAAARDLWDGQKWTPELKETCRKQYIQPYAKDYRSAVQCVTGLEKQRQEMEMNEAYIDRKRREHKTYRSWGGVIIK
jgi:hypothetical protein